MSIFFATINLNKLFTVRLTLSFLLQLILNQATSSISSAPPSSSSPPSPTSTVKPPTSTVSLHYEQHQMPTALSQHVSRQRFRNKGGGLSLDKSTAAIQRRKTRSQDNQRVMIGIHGLQIRLRILLATREGHARQYKG